MVLMELDELQDKEVGDGTTSVIIVATELLKRANDLVRNKIHPTSIISGYRIPRQLSSRLLADSFVQVLLLFHFGRPPLCWWPFDVILGLYVYSAAIGSLIIVLY